MESFEVQNSIPDAPIPPEFALAIHRIVFVLVIVIVLVIEKNSKAFLQCENLVIETKNGKKPPGKGWEV